MSILSSELTNRATPSQFCTSPLAKLHLPSSKDRIETLERPDDHSRSIRRRAPVRSSYHEPKAKACKRDPTPELVIVDDDNSTPLPGRQKTPKRLLPVEEEATEALIQRLKGEARAVQYNLELVALVDYRNKSVLKSQGASQH